jgi:hypothetical protein
VPDADSLERHPAFFFSSLQSKIGNRNSATPT